MEGEDTKPNKTILSTEVLLGTQADNSTFQTFINTGLSTSLMSNKAAQRLQQMQLGQIKKLTKPEWNMQAGNFQTIAIILAENLTLPQFTTKQTFQTIFHVLQK